MDGELSKDELAAVLGVRQERGAEIEPALVDSLAAKVERVVEQQLAAERMARPAPPQHCPPNLRLALAIVSVAVSIPLTAISLSLAGFPGLLLVWTGIVLVNISLGMSWPKK